MSWAIREKDYSQRRACGLVGLEPKTYRYARRSVPDDALIRHRLKEIGFGTKAFYYRRLHIMLRREGIVLNHKKLYRLYREERLMVRKRGGRKRALGTESADGNPAGERTNAGRSTLCPMRSLAPQVPYPGRGR